MILAQPADGLEQFFTRFAALPTGSQHDAGALAALFRECGMELLGPPLEDDVMPPQ